MTIILRVVVILGLLGIAAACQTAPPSSSVSTTAPTISSPLTAPTWPALTPSPAISARPPTAAPTSPPGDALQPPALDQLLALIALNWERHDEWRSQTRDEWAISALAQETQAVDRHIAAYLEQFYPNGLPDVDRFAEEIVPKWREWPYYHWDSVKKLLLTSTVAYLNAKQIRFVAGQPVLTRVFSVTPIPLDAADQTHATWLAQIDFAEYGLRAFLPLTHGPDGVYTGRANTALVYTILDSNTVINLDATHDFNADGHKDIVIARQSYFAGSLSGSLSLYTWDGRDLSAAGEVNLPSVNPRYGETSVSDYTLVDPPGGPAEMRVVWPRFRAFGCAWNTEFTYRWAAGQLTRSALNERVPDRPECYIAKALDSERLEDQAAWFQIALTQAISDNASADKRAWLLVRLAVALAAQGREGDAGNVLTALAALPGGGNFSKAAQDAYARAGPGTLGLCKALYTTAVDLAKAGARFDSDIDEGLAPDGVYPISFEPNPGTVCPYWDLLKLHLQAKPIAGTADPAPALSIDGQSVELTQAANLDADSIDEYIGILPLERPLIVILDATDSGWRVFPVEFVDRLVIGLSATAALTTPEAAAPVLVLVQFDTSTRGETPGCAPGSKDFLLILTASGAERFQPRGWRGFSCQTHPPVELQTAQGQNTFQTLVNECNGCALISDIPREQPSWVAVPAGLQAGSPAETDVFRYIDAIDHELLQGENLSQNQAQITQLLEQLPGDVPSALILKRHLRYLKALGDELEGRVDLARAGYLRLIQDDPDTLWARLAQTRLATTTPTGTP